MRQITLETVDGFDERAQLQAIVETAPTSPMPGHPGGYNIGQVRMACGVLGKLAVEGALMLEEEEYRFVTERVAAIQWMGAKPQIVAFVDKITNAPKFTPAPADKPVDPVP